MRLLDAVVREVVARGYANTSVTSLADAAGITRAGFYKLFADREECVLAGFEHAALRLQAAVEKAGEGAGEDVDHRVLRAIVEVARKNRDDFLLVAGVAMTGGPRLVERRYAVVSQICEVVEAGWERSSRRAQLPDLPALLLIGGVMRYLTLVMGHGPVRWERETTGLEAWIDCYRAPAASRRWTSIEPDAAVAASARGVGAKAARLRASRGEPVSMASADALERDRIVHATAEVVSREGYAASAVAEIATLAGVSREAFYRRFPSKQAALDAATTLLFEEAIAAMGGAYFGAGHAMAGADLGELARADLGVGQRPGASRTSRSSTRSRRMPPALAVPRSSFSASRSSSPRAPSSRATTSRRASHRGRSPQR